MRKKTICSLAVLGILANTSAYAQFGGLLDNLKKKAEEVQKQIEAPQPTRQTSAPNNPTTAQPTSPVENMMPKSLEPVSQSADTLYENFKKNWCKTTDNSASSQAEFKGLRTGDLCLAPKDLVLSLAKKLESFKQPMWLTDATLVPEGSGGGGVYENLVAGDISLFSAAILVNPTSRKVYLASFSALTCAADPSNSLNKGNPFRKALEQKYGSPSSTRSLYDTKKAEVDELEKLVAAQKKRALTVSEMRKAQEAEAVLPSLKATVHPALKDQIEQIIWDFDKSSPFPIGKVIASEAVGRDIRNLGGYGKDSKWCEFKTSEGEPFGFRIAIAGTKRIQAIENEVNQKNAEIKSKKIQNAPAPKF